jgi:hypothetical protein
MSPQLCKVNLEDIWRLRLEQAAERYHAAQANCAMVLDEFKKGLTVSLEAVMEARIKESAALQEHIRILRIFSDLKIHGKIPTEE